MKYVEHEERPEALNDLGKKIQLVLKVIEAHRNKVLGCEGSCGGRRVVTGEALSPRVQLLKRPNTPNQEFFNEELPVEDSKTFKIWGFHRLDFPEAML